jgi:GntR family transcriptional regulator/MocR family aminotransferase
MDRQPGETLRRTVERILRVAILDGVLLPGTKLPSSRELAAYLGVSRGVVTESYSQLEAQGFLVSRLKAPPIVAAIVSAKQHNAESPQRQPPRAPRYDLAPATPAVTLFPVRRWTSALVEAVRTAPTATFDYRDPRGERQLREALGDHLGRTRGVVVAPTQLIIVQGAAQAINIIAGVLAVRGARRVAIEDPSLDTQPQRIRAHGLQVVGQPVDAEGLVVDGLCADAVLLTPAHQFPTGVVLSGRRRIALTEWARRHDALLIEDDYDAEFRYDRQPVRAMQGRDPDRVAYVGTTSKSLAPALRLGWLVLPADMVDEATRIKHLLDVCSPPIDQLALARFLTRGDYDRHLRRVAAIYRTRRDRLLAALAAKLPDLAVEGVAAGLHVLLSLPAGSPDRWIAQAAAGHGVRVTPLSDYTIEPSTRTRSGLVLGYGRLHEDAIEPAVTALAQAIRHGMRLRAGRADYPAE